MDLRGLLKSSKLAEVEFIVEGKKIPAHLVILYVRCPKLVQLVENTKKTLKSGYKIPLQVKDIKSDVFISFLEFIYSGILPCDPTQSVFLRDCAIRFELERCRELATYHIKKHVDSENVLSLLQAADDLNDITVKNYALCFIAKNYDDVAFSSKIKELRQELLVEVLRVPTKEFKEKKKKIKEFDDISEATSSSELKDALLSLVGNEKYSDINFIVDSKNIPAHYCILYSRHPVFTQMWFENGMKESITREVTIEGVGYDAWLQLLRYMYSGIVELINLQEALDLIFISDRYLLDSLKSHCENYVTTCLTSENVLEVLKVADKCRLPQLKDLCLDLLSNNFTTLAKWEKELNELSGELLVQVIVSHARSCSHIFTEP